MIGPSLYRLQWRRRMTRRYRAVAIGLAIMSVVSVILPAGISTENTPVVTGHSTFYNGDDFDPCLGAIVGIMRLRVMWFNHQVLVERYNGDGAYIYATEYGAPDPTSNGANLVSSGVFYDFVDPNGIQWHVDEAYWEEMIGGTPVTYGVSQKPDGTPDVQVGLNPYYTKRWYTWIVAVQKPVHDAFRGDDPHDFYNFVNIVNTCKFRRDNIDNSTRGTEHHNTSLGPSNGHLKNDDPHEHESYEVALWVGSQPAILPVGTETPYRVATEAGIGLQAPSDPSQGDDFNNDH